MMKSEIKMQRLSDGRHIVTVDGASKECQSFGEALDIFRSETGTTPSSRKWDELEAENARLKKALDSAAADFEKLRDALEKEKAEKNKYLLEAFDVKSDMLRFARFMARKCG